MTHAEIAALVLEENLSFLFGSLVDTSALPEGEVPFYYDSMIVGTEYEKWVFHASVVKPTLLEVEAEFDQWKAELTAAEDARLLELARVTDITDRFNAMEDIRLAMNAVADYTPNPAMVLKDIIETNDQARLAALEAAYAPSVAALNQATIVANAKKVMDAAIYAEMYLVFGTTDPHSANAFSQSWKLKAENAAQYVADGLLAFKAVGGFTVGQALDTTQKIQDYYNALLATLITFDKFRDQKIAEYLQTIA